MNGKDLLRGMSFIDEKLIAEADTAAPIKVKNFFLKKYLVAAACLVFIAAIAISLNKFDIPHGFQKLPEHTYTPVQPPYEWIDPNNVALNEIKEIVEYSVYYDPDLYDIHMWNADDIIRYYGKDLTPLYIPAFLYPSRYNKSTKAVYEKNGEIVSDSVTMKFYTGYNEDGSPKLFQNSSSVKGITVQASKTGTIASYRYVLSMNKVKKTDIGGVQVLLGKKAPSANFPQMYTAEFAFCGINYNITALQMELSEVLKTVASIIWSDGNIAVTE